MSKLFSLFVLCLWAAEVAQASSTVAVVTMLFTRHTIKLIRRQISMLMQQSKESKTQRRRKLIT